MLLNTSDEDEDGEELQKTDPGEYWKRKFAKLKKETETKEMKKAKEVGEMVRGLETDLRKTQWKTKMSAQGKEKSTLARGKGGHKRPVGKPRAKDKHYDSSEDERKDVEVSCNVGVTEGVLPISSPESFSGGFR